MEIIKESRTDFTKVDKYLMTAGKGAISVKDVEDGTSIPVYGYIEFIDEKEDGTKNEILAVITEPNGQVYSAQSKTFKRSLMEIIDVMEDEPFSIKKISGITKAGRPYVDCELDTESLKDVKSKKK